MTLAEPVERAPKMASDSADVGTPGYQECCLEEVQLALPHLAGGALILIDDTPRVGGAWTGKGATAVQVMRTIDGDTVEGKQDGFGDSTAGCGAASFLEDGHLAQQVARTEMRDVVRGLLRVAELDL